MESVTPLPEEVGKASLKSIDERPFLSALYGHGKHRERELMV